MHWNYSVAWGIASIIGKSLFYQVSAVQSEMIDVGGSAFCSIQVLFHKKNERYIAKNDIWRIPEEADLWYGETYVL